MSERQGSGRHASHEPRRTATKQPALSTKEGRRPLLAVIAVLLLAVIGIGIFTGVTALKDEGAPSRQKGEFGEVNQPAMTSEMIAAREEAKLKAELAWRDTDFAVDPSRTDWNFSSNGEKIVYLTFDDGPSYNTQAVLDILDQYGCKATFFVTNINPDYAGMIKIAYDKGHTIGMHTSSHDYAKVYASADAYFADLDRIAATVEEQIGYVPCFIRFPGGSSNTVSRNYSSGIMTYLSGEVQARGYQYYDWNVSCGDGSVNPTEVLINESIQYDDYTNIILLMHDANNKETTVEALPAVIEHYQALGFEFKAIDRETMVPHHGIGN